MVDGRLLRLALLAAGVALSCLVACGGSSGTQDGDGGSDAGPPSLTSLAVTGAGVLRPAFSPQINDYYVICAAGANSLSVAMTASTGSVSLLVDPSSLAPTSKSAAMQTVSVTVQPNDAVVAVAQNPTTKAAVQYWVRCLPPDFLPIVATRHAGGGTLQPGYYLAGTLTSNGDGNFAGYAMILNQNGVPVWYVPQADNRPVLDVDYVVPGSISFSFQPAPSIPGNPTPDTPFTVVNPSTPSKTTILGPTGPTGYHVDAHELLRTADGNYVVLEYLETPGVDLTGLNDPMTGAPLGPNATILDCAVVEFKPSGTVVSTWKASDHFEAAKVTTWQNEPTPEKSGPVYDVIHCNSVDIDPANGNYLVSARQMDSIFYVDHKSGNVLWKLGGKPSSKDSPPPAYVSFAEQKDSFHGQHDARLMKGWEPGCRGGTGRVSVFDDETAPSGAGNARGAVYNVVVGATGETGCTSGPPDGGAPAAGTAKLAISYPAQQESVLGGNVRFYDDGSRVVSWGLGPGDQLLTEYDEQGHDLLDLNFTQIAGTYRGLKFPLSTFDINALRKAVGH
jgi:Arylsulfotransferase (ASST)